MAPHAYQSLEPGAQIVISEDPREDLEALARWETIPVADAKAILKQRDAAASPKAPAKTAAEKKVQKIAADEEAARIAALPIHVGDTVGLTVEALALVATEPDVVAEVIEKAAAWRAVVTAVRRDDDTDEDVAEFEDGPAVLVADLALDEIKE
ncbi:hypothetical protein [Microterricola viridarii]|uniref:Uncharacterized protein n=1 Tax=Microterricola viridarii TaxID=412690 RepID=A0A1H1YMJ7_9MICO|nr:hypothetical protein [Microterricola viridarii]SDT22575.1 hypothetical protein SAMN04489834_3138 [Microterricola viridarii]